MHVPNHDYCGKCGYQWMWCTCINGNKTKMKKAKKLDPSKLWSVKFDRKDKIYVAMCKSFPSLAAHGSTKEKAINELKALIRIVMKDVKNEMCKRSLTTRKRTLP